MELFLGDERIDAAAVVVDSYTIVEKDVPRKPQIVSLGGKWSITQLLKPVRVVDYICEGQRASLRQNT